MNILDKLSQQIQKTPKKIAIETKFRNYSYKEVGELSDYVCKLILDKGIHSKKIALFLEHNETIIFSILGVLKSGNTYIPIEKKSNFKKIENILKISQCTLLISDENNKVFSDFFEPQKILNIDYTFRKNIEDNIFFKEYSLANNPYILFTSGSTGMPKGVVIKWTNLTYIFKNVNKICGLNKNSKLLFSTNYTFDVSVLEIFGWIEAKGSLFILDLTNKDDFKSLPYLMHKHSISHATFSPSVLRILFELMSNSDFELINLNLKCISIAGEKFDPEIFNICKKKGIEAKLINFYGPTEATIYATYYLLNKKENYLNVPIGIPLDGVSYKIEFLPSDKQKGELILYGDGIAEGYLNLKDNLSFGIDKEGNKFYKTGDIVSEERGNLIFWNRKDDQIQRNGIRIELGEIEHYLNNMDNVVLSTVIYEEKVLYAFIKPKKSKINVEDLMEILPSYMVPNKVINLSNFPLTSSGKINKNFLRKKIKPQFATEYIPNKENSNEIELDIIKIFSILFKNDNKIKKFNRESNFYELGGDSLSAMILISMLEKKFNINLNVEFLLINRNISSISDALYKILNNNPNGNNSQKVVFDSFEANKQIEKNLMVLPDYLVIKTTKTHYIQKSYFYKEYNEFLFFEFYCESKFSESSILKALRLLILENDLLRSSLYEERGELYFKEYFISNLKIPIIQIDNLSILETLKKIIKEKLKYSKYKKGLLVSFVLCKFKEEYIILGGLDHCIADAATLNIIKKKISDALMTPSDTIKKELSYSEFCKNIRYWNGKNKILTHPYINKLRSLNLESLDSIIKDLKEEPQLLKIKNIDSLNNDYINLLGAYHVAKKLLISLDQNKISINLIKNIRKYGNDNYEKTLGDMHSRIPLIYYKNDTFLDFYNNSLNIINTYFKKNYFCPRYFIYSNFPKFTKKQLELKNVLEDSMNISYSFLGVVNKKQLESLTNNISAAHTQLNKLGKNKIYATAVLYNRIIYIFCNKKINQL